MGKCPVVPVVPENGGVVCGTYTGDDATSRFINLGFAPKAVLLVEYGGAMAGSGYRSGGLAFPGYPSGFDGKGSYALSISGNGFYVAKKDYLTTNTGNIPYYYLAFR